MLADLTLNLGVRWDRQEIFDRFGRRVIDLKDDYAPRLGFIWDPGRRRALEGLRLLRPATTSRSRWTSSSARSRSERQARIFNYDPLSTTPDAGAEARHRPATR